MAGPDLEQVLKTFWPAGPAAKSSVWAILDGARDPCIFHLLLDSGLDYLCLYSGHLPRALQLAAPYLVELPPDRPFARRLLEQAWGHSWGIFVSIKDSSNLRHHLRTFLRVRDEAGKFLLFRYYDPRVLRTYLPTCLPNELKTVFGPISRYLVEDQDPQTLIEFTFDGSRLQDRRIRLQGKEGP
ncbi:MAG: DUF4123 domain-containing protein [Planctomycetota bacterium]|nr:DUF4123 domain-containing protein [Planctomycetota bacterium]